MSKPAHELGRKLRVVRVARGMSQQQLATASGVCREAISRIELGLYYPRRATLSVIADALEVEASMLREPFDFFAPKNKNAAPTTERRPCPEGDRVDASDESPPETR